MRKRWNRHLPLFSSSSSPRPPRQEWRFWPLFWLGLKRLCTVLGAIVLIFVVFVIYGASKIGREAAPPLPQDMVLYLPFDGDLDEVPQAPGLVDPFSTSAPTILDTIEAIDEAAADPRVKGIFARLDGSGFSLTHVQELRQAIKRFRATGKFTAVYSSSYGDEGGGFGGYYLASAFDQIWMQPMGVVSVTGLHAEVPFFREALEKIGIQPQFFQRKEFKTAYESATNKTMSEPNREETTQLISDIHAQMVADISADRKISPQAFEALVNKGLFTAKEAQKAGLITTAYYADQLVGDILEGITGDRESKDEVFVDVGTYNEDVQRPNIMGSAKPKVALIYAVGLIMPSDSGGAAPGLMSDGKVAAADVIAPAIMEAADDPDVEAIVLRVDSPGGSPTASESILRALEKAQEKGKPVIVSMGSAAASGGYWIATGADYIFAMPSTLTGSIGVLGGKVSLEEVWKKIGVHWDTVAWGENSGLWGFNKPFTESEAERFNAMLDQIYDGFVERVSDGRNMTPEDVEKIARGRVWSGLQAEKNGLIDELGGLDDAFDYTAELLGMDTRADLDIEILPMPETPFEQFMDFVSGGQVAASAGNFGWRDAMEFLAPILREAHMLKNPKDFMTYEPLKVQ